MEISGCGRDIVCFCQKFCIAGIKRERGSFSLPFSEYKNRKYKNIFVDKKDVYIKILDCLNWNKTSQSLGCDVKPRLIEFVDLKSSSRVANAFVGFDGINVVFGIIKKNDHFFALPPKEFIFIDDEYKKDVLKYIIDLWRKR